MSETRRWALAGQLLIAAVGAALLIWTWRAWPDPVVDFGRELYVPWRLAEGELLFRDIAWFNGPLSPYLNSLWFRLFGTGLMTLAWANLGVLIAALALSYRILARLAGTAAATVGCLVFLAMFAFAQLVGFANYNWIAPYSHEATHGLALALASFAGLAAWRRSGRRAPLVLGGLALGANFLTKPETFLAAAAAGLVLVVAGARGRGRPRGDWIALGISTLTPPLLALGLLAGALPLDQALRGVLGAWPSVLEGEVSRLAFYRAGMGIDEPGARLSELLGWSGRWLLGLAPALALAWALRREAGSRARTGVAVAAAAACAGMLWFLRAELDWPQIARPLPLFVLVVGAVAGAGLIAGSRGAGSRGARSREPGSGGEGSGPLVPALAFAALAAALLLKMVLRAQLGHYGFTLALPAVLLLAAALCGWVPAWLRSRGRAGEVFAAAATGLLLATAAVHLTVTSRYLQLKTETVGSGADAFRADVRGRFVNEAVRTVTEPPGGRPVASMAVLPEGVLLNYLARIPNPTPYINFMPPELILFGEARWLEAFSANPPEVLFLVHKDTSEYGYRYFGTDYATELAGWVRDNYTTVGLMGQEPLRPGTGFGVRMFARRPPE